MTSTYHHNYYFGENTINAQQGQYHLNLAGITGCPRKIYFLQVPWSQVIPILTPHNASAGAIKCFK